MMLHKLDVRIMKRIAHYLLKEDMMKRSKLASVCSMNYAALVEYLKWMENFDLVVVGHHVRLTQRGKKVLT